MAGSSNARVLGALNPNYGKGEVSLEDEPEGPDWSEVIRQVVESPAFKPPMLPSAVVEVMTLARKPDVDLGAIQKVLEHDTLLVGEVLKLARSPMYYSAMPVRNLREAMSRVGLSGLRNVVLEAAMRMTVFRDPSFAPTVERVRVHSAAVARLMRAIARLTPVDAEFAFLVGLMHDVGIAVALMALSHHDRVNRQSLGLDVARWYAIEQSHEVLSQRIGLQWGLPPEVVFLLGSHHGYERDPKLAHPALAVLSAAEFLAHKHGASTRPTLLDSPEPSMSDARTIESYLRACDTLRLTDAVRAKLQQAAPALVADGEL